MRIDQFFMSKETIERLDDIILLTSLDGSILDANGAALACYGHSHTEILALNISDLRTPNAQVLSSGTAEPRPWSGKLLETKHVRRDGTVFPVQVWSAPVIVDGENALLEVVHDASEQRRSEEELRSSNMILSTVQETSLDGILVVDQDARILSYNRRFAAMWHIPEEIIVGGIDEPLLQHNADQMADRQSFVERVQYLYEHPRETSRDEIVLSDGRVFDRYSSPMVGTDQEYFGRVWYFRDVTEDKRIQQILLDMVTSVTDVIGTVSEMRDPYTAGHQKRVAELAVEIARDMGMPGADVVDLRNAALLHDVGKMSVPAEILTKPGSLMPVEFELVKQHAEAGYRIIRSAKVPGPIADLVYQHQERCDGSGYPRGLVASELLEGSKVLMVADVVEAMMSHRPYRSALGMDAALAEIERGAGTQYDSRVAESCIRVVRDQGFTFSEA